MSRGMSDSSGWRGPEFRLECFDVVFVLLLVFWGEGDVFGELVSLRARTIFEGDRVIVVFGAAHRVAEQVGDRVSDPVGEGLLKASFYLCLFF